ncbi:pyrroline-5-carboxylate reductase [Alteromonas sp. 5E99-2]|uniref:pyrroline-5-carboxylate reductase n=1 Tax=Alteromonas sp. 5E99-2 TaxID=2817683 RepID=UPI001A997E1B|nr:pyrroline-5-carboxylate reductase [Alteromonas sp. 5E99-2]MBO1256387.1 pyrroline-5-carboxylate reductase [Alteromonas sp. 5E99-2]
MQTKSLTFIGAGNMSRSIISGLVNSGYPASKIMACNRSSGALDSIKSDFGVNVSTNNDEGIDFADVVVLAVKPQMMADMCEALNQHGRHADTLFISIAAGISIPRLQQMLGNSVPVVRVMPNTPSLLGKGMSGLYADDSISNDDKAFVEHMMNAVGTTVWVNNESDINGVIAAAGSSPAYFFLFLQAMQEESIAMGFDKETARAMVQQAMLGAAEMVCHNPTLELSELRAQVTSKGGTTAQAVNTFIDNGLKELVSKSMQAAVTRAQEMEKTF